MPILRRTGTGGSRRRQGVAVENDYLFEMKRQRGGCRQSTNSGSDHDGTLT
jgi:hypothetical protein